MYTLYLTAPYSQPPQGLFSLNIELITAKTICFMGEPENYDRFIRCSFPAFVNSPRLILSH